MGFLKRIFHKRRQSAESTKAPVESSPTAEATERRCPVSSVTLGTIVASESLAWIQVSLESLRSAALALTNAGTCTQAEIIGFCAEERADINDESANTRIVQPSEWQPIAGEMGAFPEYFEYLDAMLPFLAGEVVVLMVCGHRFSDSCLESLPMFVESFARDDGCLLIPYPQPDNPMPEAAVFSRKAAQEYGILMFAADGWPIELQVSGWATKYKRTGSPRSVRGHAGTFDWLLAAIAAYYAEDKPGKGLWVRDQAQFKVLKEETGAV